MQKFIMPVAAAVLAISPVTAPTEAEARRGAVAAGIIGGLAAGAIIGSAAYPYYPHYGYYPAYPAPAYYPPPTYPPPGCVIKGQRVWDGYAWRWRRIRVCY